MYIKVYFFLVLFASFLVTPAIINLFPANNGKIVFAIAEEENNHDHKLQLKKDLKFDRDLHSLSVIELKLRKVISNRSSAAHCSIYLDPVSPPPRLA